MNKKNHGFFSYVVILITFVVIAVMLNGSLNTGVSKRIEYPQLLQMIKDGEVSAVAIRSSTLVGLKKGGATAASNFPENGYDF